ncbi:PREDICTED: uncharacterized protein LOC105155030 [Acromyrmex echinatior]|uniref:uncharacterized protein LOC105155030 n=1 Tax=Acromyrmex echinatior TaxID=103372 RepID=UPI000580D4AB|nr:PREDICTED: uncharacterized protein LOC105155030 [Acromyrmex echinatior]
MNSYVPFQQNKAWEKDISFNNSSSKPHYTSHILGRRFALTLTAYKYLDIGINVGSMSFVELLIGDNRGNRIILSYTTWKIFIERRMNIERLLQSTVTSSLMIGDLELEKCHVNIVKLKSRDTCLYMKPLTVAFMFKLEHCIEHVYIGLCQNIHDVNKKFNKFVTILRQSCITDKCNAARILYEIHDKTSLIECELLIYALDNIVNDALHKK